MRRGFPFFELGYAKKSSLLGWCPLPLRVLRSNHHPQQKLCEPRISDCNSLTQAAVEQLTGEHSTPTPDFFRAISAAECLVVQ
jgi:hypothetical protein